MRTSTIAWSIVTLTAYSAHAQLAYDPATKSLKCAKADGIYCAGDSLSQSIIVHCKSSIGTPSSCGDELSSIPPLGLKAGGLCFQTSSTSGDAACAINGTVYPTSGSPFALPAPAKPAVPVPAVINIADTPPKNCDCHNSTLPLGPAGPTGPIAPPPAPPASTPVSPVQPVGPSASPPSGPAGPVVPPPAGPVAPPPPGPKPMPTGTAVSYSHSSKTHSPTTLASGWNPKPTPTNTAVSSSPAAPISTGAAGRRTVPAMVMCMLGFVAIWL